MHSNKVIHKDQILNPGQLCMRNVIPIFVQESVVVTASALRSKMRVVCRGGVADRPLAPGVGVAQEEGQGLFLVGGHIVVIV